MPKAVFELSWSSAQESYVCVSPPSGEASPITPESPAWFAWLAERSSFAFHGQEGSYTARLEAVQRGERYWYAYLRTGQQVRKKYLGKTADLTLARLEQVARLLHPEQVSTVLPDTALPKRKAHHAPARTSQVITPVSVQHTLDEPAPVVQTLTDAAPVLPAQPLQPHLATKFYVPRPTARLVHRSRLIERLKQGFSQTLILVSAPAGFGKTTLVAELLADCGLPAAWLSLDAEDNDPQRFLSALLAAFQTRDPSIGAALQALLSSPHGLQGLSLSAVFAQLLNDLASRSSGEFLLVLDDYHTLTSEPLQHALASLVEHCPPNLHLVLTTRSDPPLALARLRARGQLCELRAIDLQFDAAETHAFLRTALGRDLSPSMSEAILNRTEGWIAGLQLTALLLQGEPREAEVQQLLAESLGSHRYLVEYLGEEVFAHQPEAVQAFLLRTCILPRLSAPLCAAVSEGSLAESAAMLTLLEQANLFLAPLDGRGEWYRYHALWAAVLRVLLLRKLGATGVAALYGRASRWYEQQDLPSEAIEAAIQAGEFERAVGLVDQLCPLLLARGQYYTLRRWIEQLPHELWAARPMIGLVYAWALFLSGARDAYLAPLEEAEQLFRRQEHSVGVGRVEELRGLAALWWADGREALRAGRQALALSPEGDPSSRSLGLNLVGGGHWLLGEVEMAWQSLQEARPLLEQSGNLPALLGNSIVQGHTLVCQGRLHEAAQRYQQVIEREADLPDNAIEASIWQAGIRYEWNALPEAEAQLARVIAESPTVTASMFFARGGFSLAYVLLARIKAAQGEHAAVTARLRQALAVAREPGHPRYLALAQAAQVRLWLAQGYLEAVMRWRDEEGRAIDTTPGYLNEPGALTLARVLLAQGESEEALRMLSGFRALARNQRRLSSELEMLVLSALAEDARGQNSQAIQLLEQALGLAEPEGYVRLFVDEGVPMLNLLRQVAFRSRGKHGGSYVRRLLDVLQAEHPEQAEQLPGVPVLLSGRERTILRLLAAGRSTAEMADELVVSANTVKAQLGSLYRKLNVHSREQALSEAVRLHVL